MADLPTRADILKWIEDNPTRTSKRDISKAFGIKGAARIDLKRLLKELQADGHLQKRKRSYRDPGKLPPVSVLEIAGQTPDGDQMARALEWDGAGPEPQILFIPRNADPALGPGDRILARLTEMDADTALELGAHYEARLIRRIGTNPSRILGVFRKSAEGGRVVPVDKKADREWAVPAGATHGARDGELVEAEQSGPKARMGLPRARVIERLGDPSAPKAVSLIAIHQHGIRDDFPDDVMAAADAAQAPDLKGRVDLRHLPLITIDPSDARDHDDACCAFADDDPDNPGGHLIWVAIADVAHFVRPGSPLDREARTRGNSTYFPDRVVPMLPDILSGDLCSLHEGVDRACLAVCMKINAEGQKISHHFERGIMNSPASLHYEEVQEAIDGAPTDRTSPHLEGTLRPLYAAYAALVTARKQRQPLALDLPERHISLGEDGKVASVNFKERLDAHKLIEEFMVLANVAAAETLAKAEVPLVYRVHEEPSPEKLDALRETARASGLVLAKGQVLKTGHLNHLLTAAAGTDHAELINITTLRSMTQAYYSPDNMGHFGLALQKYAHFTSPIRRYADLIVHRALVTAHKWGGDGLSEDRDGLAKTAQHISETERRSMTAERDTTDRYLAAYLSERVGNEMPGRIAGIARFGAFVKLDETGADGLVPIRSLGREYFHHDAELNTLTGSDSGREIRIGQRVLARLAEATPVTGGIILELLEIEGEGLAQGPARGRGKPPKRKFGPKGKGGKRKVTRKRK